MKTNFTSCTVCGAGRRGPLARRMILLCVGAALTAGGWIHAATAAEQAPAATTQSTEQEHKSKDLMNKVTMRAPMSNGLYKASDLIGWDIHNRAGQSIGEVKDLALDMQQGQVRYAVLSFGGLLGVGDKFFAVPLSNFGRGQDPASLVLDVNKQLLEQAQGFDKDHWPAHATLMLSGADAGVTRAGAGGMISKASAVLGAEVRSPQGKELGDIGDLAVDLQQETVKYAVLSHGGLMGVGSKLIAVPVQSLSRTSDDDELTLTATKEQIDNTPGFDKDSWPAAANTQWNQGDTGMAAAPGGTVKGGGLTAGKVATGDFQSLDRDRDGYVSKAEAAAKPALASDYDNLDRNQDGRLDQAEFARFEAEGAGQSQGADPTHRAPQSDRGGNPAGTGGY